MPTDLPIFSPSPEIIPKILDDLCDPDLTLREIADKARTTVEALSLWLSSPEIQSRITLIQSTIAQRTRLAATCYLPSAVRTLTRIIDEYNDEESHVPIKPGSLMGHEYRRRSGESARRACNLLLRLARFYHEPAPRSSSSGGGGRRGRPEGDLRQPQASCAPASSLKDLLKEVAILAPTLHSFRGVAGECGSPALAHRDREIAPDARVPGASDDPRIGETLDPHLVYASESPERELGIVTTSNHHTRNGHIAIANEHWP